jgi:methyl-accepting chemotaxis protein
MNSFFLSKLSGSLSKLYVGIVIALMSAVMAVVLGVLNLDQAARAAAALSAVASAYALVQLASERRRTADTSSDEGQTADHDAQMGDSDARATMASVPDQYADQYDDSSSLRVLDKIALVCREVSKGNFEARLTNVTETGDLAAAQHAVNDMIDRCDAFVREASAAMDAVRHHKYYRRILREGLNGSLDSAAAMINDATAAIQKRAAAFDAAGIDIRRGVDRSTQIARQAVTRADEANRTMKDLSSAADSIGEAVSLIGTIASQTNLLALNAAIEAAHAGETGKGFAVVAQEVKSLSTQTALATKEISTYMTQVLSSTKSAVDAIEVMGNIIHEIDQSTTLAMQAILSQVAATDESTQRADPGSSRVGNDQARIAARG